MLERWQEGHGPVLDSPPLLAGIRGDSTERALAEWLTRASTVTAARSRPSS